MVKVVSGRQLTICTPPPASDAGLEEDRNTRSNSDDLFISDLWRLLDTSNSIFSLPIGQDSRKQARIKKSKF